MDDKHVLDLRDRLVGKTVVSVEQSPLSEHYYLIGTSDGRSFHIGATELGSWITDGPGVDGSFPTIKSLAAAVDHARDAGSVVYDVPVVIVRSGDRLLIDPGDGSTLSISRDSVSDPWEKRVLSHRAAPSFLRTVLNNTFLGWVFYFRKSRTAHPGEEDIVPDELLLDDDEARLRM